RACYKLLHLITYFTVGPKETRAWTIERVTKAPQAAGVIHSDFERGFILANTIAYDDYIKYNDVFLAFVARLAGILGADFAVVF
ncbi:DUF933 domain-containing protein, partial [Rhizobium leguminosarum]|uniref:DUF933 domain-containing protein n=1 Tax=Rhizobium leguminosarum TaxID=384 RepID=UPI003F9EB24A